MFITEIILTGGYLATLILCVMIALSGNSSISSDQVFWHRSIFLGITLTLIILLALRFLDITDYLTEEARNLAKNEGWYEGRKTVQIMFVSGVIISLIVSLIMMEPRLDTIWKYYSISFYGLIMLVGFNLITIASYHPIDQLFKRELIGIKYNRIYESLNIFWILVTLYFNFRRSKNRTKILTLSQSTKFI